MEIKHVKSFLAVAKSLNFSRAARALHLSQPALSTQIAGLEASLGAALFLRNRRKVSLTPAGQAFLADAETLLHFIAEMELRVSRIAAGDAGHLRIGFVASATLDIVPAVALAFRKLYPKISYELKNLPTVGQVDALRNGSIDVGFLRLPLDEAGLAMQLVHREPFAIALSKDHRLARKKDLQVSDLAGEEFIAYGERWAPAFYQTWTGLCRAAGYTPHVVQETGEMDTAAALVAAGLGVAILPRGITQRHRGLLATKVLDNHDTYSEIGVAFLKERETPLITRLVEVARQIGHR